MTTKTDTRTTRLAREVQQLTRDLTQCKRERAQERARKPLRIEYRGTVS